MLVESINTKVEVKIVELLLFIVPFVLVRMKCICMYKLQNTNWVIFGDFAYELNGFIPACKTSLVQYKDKW